MRKVIIRTLQNHFNFGMRYKDDELILKTSNKGHDRTYFVRCTLCHVSAVLFAVLLCVALYGFISYLPKFNTYQFLAMIIFAFSSFKSWRSRNVSETHKHHPTRGYYNSDSCDYFTEKHIYDKRLEDRK